jgi:hypothetical protein
MHKHERYSGENVKREDMMKSSHFWNKTQCNPMKANVSEIHIASTFRVVE